MIRKPWMCWMVGGLLLFAGGVGMARFALADGAGADAGSCGTTDTPCPLQKWMRANMGAPLAAGDMDSLARALTHVAATSPDATWTTWTQFATQGAAAAAAKDATGVKASCKSCHDAFKDKYKAQYRTKPFS
jgi:hypothetical protein